MFSDGLVMAACPWMFLLHDAMGTGYFILTLSALLFGLERTELEIFLLITIAGNVSIIFNIEKPKLTTNFIVIKWKKNLDLTQLKIIIYLITSLFSYKR